MSFVIDGGSGGPRGIMYLTPEAKATFSLWNVTQNGCELRLYPEVDANGKAMPIRNGREPTDVGSWINMDHYCISYIGGGDVGKEPVSMTLTIKGDEKLPPEQRRGLQVWNQLRDTLYFRLNNGTAPSHWSRWAAETQNAVFGPKAKSKAKRYAFVRGLLTHMVSSKGPNKNISRQQPKLNCVLVLKTNATKALAELVMAENEGAQTITSDDWEKIFKYEGKLVHPQTGCLISFGRPGQADPYQNAGGQQQPASVNVSMMSTSNKSDDDQFSVVAHLHENLPVPLPDEVLKTYCVDPWSKVIRSWADEKDLIAGLEVGFPDELIIEAFKTSPQWLSERLRTIMHNGNQQAARGNTAPAAPAAQSPVTIPSAPQQPQEPPAPQPHPQSSAGAPDVSTTQSSDPPPVNFNADSGGDNASQPNSVATADDIDAMLKKLQAQMPQQQDVDSNEDSNKQDHEAA